MQLYRILKAAYHISGHYFHGALPSCDVLKIAGDRRVPLLQATVMTHPDGPRA